MMVQGTIDLANTGNERFTPSVFVLEYFDSKTSR